MTWKRGDRVKKSLAALIVIVAMLWLAAMAKAGDLSPVDRCCPEPYVAGESFCRHAWCAVCACEVRASDALRVLRWSVGIIPAECSVGIDG